MMNPDSFFSKTEKYADHWMSEFMELSADLFLAIDQAGFIQSANPASREILGIPPEELNHQSFLNFVVPADRDLAWNQFQKAKQGVPTNQFELRCLVEDGSYRWLQCNATVPTNYESFIFAVCRDITDQKHRELELSAWKSRYDAAIHIAGCIVYEWNLQTDEVIIGGQFQQTLGYTSPQFVQSTLEWIGLVHPDDRSFVEQEIEKLLVEDQEVHLEYRVRHADGSFRWLRDDAVFIAGDSVESRRMIGVLTDVTEHRQRDQILRKVIQEGPVAMLLLDGEKKVLDSNRAACELLETQPHRILGKSVLRYLAPGDQSELAQRLDDHEDLAESMIDKPWLLSLQTGAGNFRSTEVFTRKIELPTGVAFVCSFIDVSERIKAENVARDTQNLIHQIIDNSLAVIYIKDLDGRYQMVNQRFLEIFGLSREDVIGLTDDQIYEHEIAETIIQNDRRVLKQLKTISFEETVQQLDGIHDYISVKFPIFDPHGGLRGVAGISTDITDLTAANTELEKTKHRLELILQSVSDGIFDVDCEGRPTFINQSALKMLGYRADELIGQNLHNLIYQNPGRSDLKVGQVNVIQAAINSGNSSKFSDQIFWTKEGTPFPVDYQCSPIHDQGDVIGAVVTFNDLTDKTKRRQSEQELQTARVVQQQLYPEQAPVVPGFDIYGAVVPSTQACGDYFDFIQLTDDRYVFVVGDVTGHGLGPALQMVETRAILRSLIDCDADLSSVASHLNNLLCTDLPEGNFVSLFMAEIDFKSDQIYYVGAGHDAFIIRADRQIEYLESTGLLLGLQPESPYETCRVPFLEKGELLVLLTDGIIEAMSPAGKLFGRDRVYECLNRFSQQSASEMANTLLKHTLTFSKFQKQDDMTVLLVKAE